MIVIFEKSFYKDIQKNSNGLINSKLLDLIELLKITDNLSDISSVKKMHGYQDYYRIRIGNYRIGLKYDNGRVILIRLLHRKDIYKYFP